MHKDRYYQTCLKDELSRRLQKNPRYSLRSFARSLQVDPASLSRILLNQKVPTPELSQKILKNISLSPAEQKQFLQSMAKAYEDHGVQRKKPEIKKILSDLNSHVPTHDFSADLFRVISDWYHYAILQLIQTEGSQMDAKWMARELNLQEIEVKLALSRLQELNLLEEKNGKWVRIPRSLVLEDKAITTPALRKRVKQVTEKSVSSLENDSIELRNHSTLTMAIDPAKIPLAKKMIEAFTLELANALQTKKKKVYELQINLFPLQRSEK